MADPLDDALHDLRDHLDPGEPAVDVAARVRARIDAAPPAAPPRFRLPALAAAALLFVATTVIALVPTTRHAVADWLGIEGVRVRPAAPGTTVPPAPMPIAAGDRVSLDEARRRAPFPVLLPQGLGSPDEVYVATDRPEVTLVYREGIVVTQFPGDGTEYFDKMLQTGTDVSHAKVRGGRAVWISGEPHLFFYVDDGEFVERTGRLAGNTLLWEQGRRSFRLEGPATLSMARAVELAESMR